MNLKDMGDTVFRLQNDLNQRNLDPALLPAPQDLAENLLQNSINFEWSKSLPTPIIQSPFKVRSLSLVNSIVVLCLAKTFL